MRRTARITVIAALTSASALVAAPAFANGAGQTVTMPPWNWYIAAGSGEWGVSEAWYDDLTTQVFGAWNTSAFRLLGPDFVNVASAGEGLDPATQVGVVPFACDTTTLSASGNDQVVSCDQTVTTPWGLSVTSDVRVLAPGDLARMTFFITNTTAAPVELGYDYAWQYGASTGHVRSSEPTTVQDTSNDEGLLAPEDVWSYNIGSETLNAGVAWGIANQPYLGTNALHSGTSSARVELLPSDGATIDAGETIAIAFFHKVEEPVALLQGPDPVSLVEQGTTEAATDDVSPMPVPAPASSHEAQTPASFMAEFSSFSGRLTRGIPADVTVGNWQTAADDEPELAQTGAAGDGQLLVGGIAAVLLMTGIALVASRRHAPHSARR